MKTSRYSILFCVCLAFCVFSSTVGRSLAQDKVVPFIVAIGEGPGKLDPLDSYVSQSMETIAQVVEGLYINNHSSREMECIPYLAAEMGNWDPFMYNLTILLRQNVTFHDGTKFNASAVKWNFNCLQYWTYGFDLDGDEDLDINPAATASKTLFKQGKTIILNHTEIIDEFTLIGVAFGVTVFLIIYLKKPKETGN